MLSSSYTTWFSILLNHEKASGTVLAIPTSLEGSGVSAVKRTFPEVVFAMDPLFWKEGDF